MRIISLKCPECDAPITIEEGHKQCFCKYCGAKILLDDGSTTYTYRNIDAARIREAEINREIRLKELEIEKEERIHKRRVTRTKVIFSIILGLLSIPFWLTDNETYQLVGMVLVMVVIYIWLGPLIFEDNKNKK